jgi:hypothetical protein
MEQPLTRQLTRQLPQLIHTPLHLVHQEALVIREPPRHQRTPPPVAIVPRSPVLLLAMELNWDWKDLGYRPLL